VSQSVSLEISLLFFSSPPGRPNNGAAGLRGDFVIDNQSRIAAVCREIRRLAVLVLTLRANRRMARVLASSLQTVAVTRELYCAAYIVPRHSRKGVRLRRSPVAFLCNRLLRQGFLDIGERRATVDLIGVKTILLRLGRTLPSPIPPPSTIAIDHGD
jgi:hypothetical protein